MSIFSTILSKLGFGEKTAPAASTAAAPPPSAQTLDNSVQPVTTGAPGAAPGPDTQPMAAVDVVAKLDGMAMAQPETLDWKRSIVDLLKVLDLDSSLSARKELASELGCPASLMAESADMNQWLHKTVLQKLAENGGNIPADMTQ